jgi:hypothetical protein
VSLYFLKPILAQTVDVSLPSASIKAQLVGCQSSSVIQSTQKATQAQRPIIGSCFELKEATI